MSVLARLDAFAPEPDASQWLFLEHGAAIEPNESHLRPSCKPKIGSNSSVEAKAGQGLPQDGSAFVRDLAEFAASLPFTPPSARSLSLIKSCVDRARKPSVLLPVPMRSQAEPVLPSGEKPSLSAVELQEEQGLEARDPFL